jgi:hypothetical protein
MTGALAAACQSGSPRAHVITESWGESNLYCPNSDKSRAGCSSPKLSQLRNNTTRLHLVSVGGGQRLFLPELPPSPQLRRDKAVSGISSNGERDCPGRRWQRPVANILHTERSAGRRPPRARRTRSLQSRIGNQMGVKPRKASNFAKASLDRVPRGQPREGSTLLRRATPLYGAEVKTKTKSTPFKPTGRRTSISRTTEGNQGNKGLVPTSRLRFLLLKTLSLNRRERRKRRFLLFCFPEGLC